MEGSKAIFKYALESVAPCLRQSVQSDSLVQPGLGHSKESYGDLVLIGSNLPVAFSVYQARSECSLLSERSNTLDLLQEPKKPSHTLLGFSRMTMAV